MVEKEVKIKYTLDSKGAVNSSNKFEGALKNLKNIAIGVGVAGIGALTAIIYKSIGAFGEQEKATAKLNQALANTGNYSKKASQDLLDYASSLQKTTIYSDDQVVSGMTMLASFGFQGQQLKELTTATLDFASAKGIDLASASSLIAKSVGSETNALSRYGIEITGVAGSSERAKSAIAGVQRLFGGQAVAEANTMTGAIIKMKNALDDAGEEIGKVLAPLVTWLANKIGELANWFGGLSDNAKIVTLTIIGITSAMLALIPVIGIITTAVAGLGLAMSVALVGIPVLIGLVIAGLVLLKNNVETVKVVFKNGFNFIKNFILNTFDIVKIVVGEMIIDLLKQFKKLTDVLNKIPKVNITIADDSIAVIEENNKKLEDLIKERNKFQYDKIPTQKEDKKTDDKIVNNKNPIIAPVKSDKDILDQRLKEYELFSAKLNGLEQENQMQRAEYLKGILDKTSKDTEGYIDAQIQYEKLLTDIKKQQLSGYLSFFEDSQNYQTDVLKIGANAYLDTEKKKYTGSIKLWMAEQTAIASGEIASIVGLPMGLMRLLGVGVAGAGIGAIDAIKLADGGSFVVDQPTMLGSGVMAGEQHTPERIDVTPMNQQKEQTIVLNVNVGEEKVVTKIFKIGQRSRQEGYINDGLRRNF